MNYITVENPSPTPVSGPSETSPLILSVQGDSSIGKIQENLATEITRILRRADTFELLTQSGSYTQDDGSFNLFHNPRRIGDVFISRYGILGHVEISTGSYDGGTLSGNIGGVIEIPRKLLTSLKNYKRYEKFEISTFLNTKPVLHHEHLDGYQQNLAKFIDSAYYWTIHPQFQKVRIPISMNGKIKVEDVSRMTQEEQVAYEVRYLMKSLDSQIDWRIGKIGKDPQADFQKLIFEGISLLYP